MQIFWPKNIDNHKTRHLTASQTALAYITIIVTTFDFLLPISKSDFEKEVVATIHSSTPRINSYDKLEQRLKRIFTSCSSPSCVLLFASIYPLNFIDDDQRFLLGWLQHASYLLQLHNRKHFLRNRKRNSGNIRKNDLIETTDENHPENRHAMELVWRSNYLRERSVKKMMREWNRLFQFKYNFQSVFFPFSLGILSTQNQECNRRGYGAL